MQNNTLSFIFINSNTLAKSFLKWLLVSAVFLALTACQLPLMSKPDDSADKKTPVVTAKAGESGFGGTGQVAAAAPKIKPTEVAKSIGSGFGGTGIVGTITQFGSVWVNGIEVEYPKQVTVKSNLLNNDTLKIGQQVIIETVLDKTLPWTNKIEVFYPLAGKVEMVKNDHIMVDGRIVYLSKATRIATNVKIKRGHYVAINGYPNIDKSWNATLISANPAKKHLYQKVPTAKFSGKIKRLSIQTTAAQLSEWDQQFAGLPLNYIQTGEGKNQPLLLKAEIQKGKITRYELQQLQTLNVSKK